MPHKDITQVLLDAIKSESMKECLSDLNLYFYNRKHEGQIRDRLGLILNKEHGLEALTEYPKRKAVSTGRSAAVDMTVFSVGQTLATIELKHQYPIDLANSRVRELIITDFHRSVVYPTSHFILILQQRKITKEPPFPNTIKYLEKSPFNIDQCLSYLESDERFPEYAQSKEIISITVDSNYISSTYHFIIYTLKRDTSHYFINKPPLSSI